MHFFFCIRYIKKGKQKVPVHSFINLKLNNILVQENWRHLQNKDPATQGLLPVVSTIR